MLIGLVGVSGVGKSYLKNYIINQNIGLLPLIAVTTRPQRETEINNVDKYFISEADFMQRVENNEVLFVQEMYGHKYGFLINDLNSNLDLIVELYYKDCLLAKELFNATLIYIHSSNTAKILHNIRIRSKTMQEYKYRKQNDKIIHKYHQQMKDDGLFDYIFENHFDSCSSKSFHKMIHIIMNRGETCSL